MAVKCLHEGWKRRARVIVADGITGQFPHMFLRVQLRAAWREMQRLDVGMLAQIVPYHSPLVPFGAIPQDKERPSGINRLQMIEKMTGHLPGLVGQRECAFLPRTHIQRPVEMDMIALGSDAHCWRLSPSCPDPCRRRLKIQAHLIHG